MTYHYALVRSRTPLVCLVLQIGLNVWKSVCVIRNEYVTSMHIITYNENRFSKWPSDRRKHTRDIFAPRRIFIRDRWEYDPVNIFGIYPQKKFEKKCIAEVRNQDILLRPTNVCSLSSDSLIRRRMKVKPKSLIYKERMRKFWRL